MLILTSVLYGQINITVLAQLCCLLHLHADVKLRLGSDEILRVLVYPQGPNLQNIYIKSTLLTTDKEHTSVAPDSNRLLCLGNVETDFSVPSFPLNAW